MIRALEDLSIEVREGEIFGFLGPNGAGKTTMIRLLLGFLHPTAGRAARARVSTSCATASRSGAGSGYLPGGIALYDTLTGERLLDYLARAVRPPAGPPRGAVRPARAVDATLRRPVRDYSRGMRQKIGIVQALQHDPELAILDEPTEGLDPLMQRAFYDILDELRAAGPDDLLLVARPVRGRAGLRPRGDHPARASSSRSRTWARCSRSAVAGSRCASTDPPRTSRRVPGVSDVVIDGDRLSCALEGDLRPFLAAIAARPVVDLTIEPARLEEAFLELYQGESAEEELADAPAGIGAGTGPGTVAGPR